ncbi:hypothetical protein [Coleofasciculus chthonoplastes]
MEALLEPLWKEIWVLAVLIVPLRLLADVDVQVLSVKYKKDRVIAP